MKKVFTVTKLLLLIAFTPIAKNSYAQSFTADSSNEDAHIKSAINLYHHFLAPEPGLYNGSEYVYYQYYPFVINEGHPFFLSKNFNNGSVNYNGMLYENVPILFDIIKDEVLINDPSKKYIIKLNNKRIDRFTILNYTFIHLHPDPAYNSIIKDGFYQLLYRGNTNLYKSVEKIIKENAGSSEGINKYVKENDAYIIQQGNKYYAIKNKKTLLLVLSSRKKEVQQFIKKNRLKMKKGKEYAFIKSVAYYDSLDKNNSKAIDH